VIVLPSEMVFAKADPGLNERARIIITAGNTCKQRFNEEIFFISSQFNLFNKQKNQSSVTKMLGIKKQTIIFSSWSHWKYVFLSI
jgi:hypothetical protein